MVATPSALGSLGRLGTDVRQITYRASTSFSDSYLALPNDRVPVETPKQGEAPSEDVLPRSEGESERPIL